MTTDHPFYPDQIGELLTSITGGYEDQLSLYREIQAIAANQHRLSMESSLAEVEELGKLTAIIGQRQELMERLDKHNRVLAGMKKQLAGLLGLPEITMSILRQALVEMAGRGLTAAPAITKTGDQVHSSGTRMTGAGIIEPETRPAGPETSRASQAAKGVRIAGELGRVLDTLGNLLQEINQLDKETQELMNHKLNNIKTELDKLQAGKKAGELYRKAAYQQQPDPVFLDKKK